MKNLIALIMVTGAALSVICLVMRLFKIRPINKEGNQINPEDDSLFLEIKEDLDKEIEVLKLTAEELLNEIDIKFRSLKEKEIHLDKLIKLADERIEELSRKDNMKSCDDFQLNEGSHRIYELHQKGMKSVEIARNMGIGVGEVELRIGLLDRIRGGVSLKLHSS